MGFDLQPGASGSTIRGLSITSNNPAAFQFAIQIQSSNNVVVGNYIGLDLNGATGLGNYVGVFIGGSRRRLAAS